MEYYLRDHGEHVPAGQPIWIDALLNQYRALPVQGEDEPRELNCHIDVSCYSGWQSAADGVGALSYVANPYGFFCSGAMFNRIPADFSPLFMTARHCGVNAGNVTSLLVTWFYQTDGCDGNIPNPANLPQTTGAVLLVNDANTDYTLVGLSR